MARIPGVSISEATPDVRDIFERQTRAFGAPLNTTPIYALRPSILKGAGALAAGIQESGLLEGSLRSLATLRTALINGCPF